ncbi:MAG TPA: nucleotide sugar dehydrogenase [Anaerolineaceae bacterium]|nr:nucleotide sugar dehydrogenase [Anaerolineaceae bacterium]HPN52044.1 nucleotide sugar dehydrogenase [Anaerolineaceae bacterium]
MSFEHVCVLGLGYIGLPTAATFATHGMRVTGMDINTSIIKTLQQGGLHIHEPGLKTLLDEALASGNLAVSDHVVPADAFIIAVPTPFYDDKRADMRAVTSAAESIVPHLRPGNLVMIESTSPPLTTVELVAPILARSGLRPGEDFYLAYSPERVLPGQIVRELIENARVIGGITPASSQAGADLYSAFVKGQIILTNATTAEMVKLMENTYRDVNIAIANEFARLAERVHIDVWEAISIANLHPRVKILRPGPGVGGHCISVDPWFLVETAPDITPLILTARKVNDGQPHHTLDLIREAAGGLEGKRVAALGLAFKPDVDDLRESPAVDICTLLQQSGAHVRAFEPFKPQATFPGFETVPTLEDALKDADLVLLLVAHSQFSELNPAALAAQTPARLAFDAVHGWDKARWQAAGFTLFTLGVGSK